MRALIALIILFAFSAAYAVIYVNQTPNGGVEYSDTPSANSSKVDVPPVNSISSPKPVAPATIKTTASNKTEAAEDEDSPSAASTSATYTTFELVSPKNQDTFQNQPVNPVEMTVEPNMKPGDKIQLMLDNKPAGTPTATTYQELGLLERGTHTLYAVIVNNKDQVIKQTSSVTIFIHRNSVVPSPNIPKVNN